LISLKDNLLRNNSSNGIKNKSVNIDEIMASEIFNNQIEKEFVEDDL
jgi:hypothetical protein